MKIKNALLIILSMVFLQVGHGQNAENDGFNRAIGLDASFINNFLPFDNNIGNRGNYLLHFIKFRENDKFVRQAIDLNFQGFSQTNEFEIDQKDSRIELGYKIGFGKRKTAFKNAYFLYGSEFGINYFMNKREFVDPSDPNDDRFNVNLDQSFGVSFGPMVGFGYNIFKRFSLFIEASYQLGASFGVDKFESEFDPNLDFKNNFVFVNSTFALPRSLIIFYHF